MRFDYRLLRVGDGLLLAEGSTRLACVDDKGALRRLHGEMHDVLARAEAV
jgi:acyl-CoA thioesterase FadM